MNQYSNYKPSNIDWIGDIPAHWRLIPLKYLLLPGKDGIRIGPFGSSLKAEFIKLDGLKVYGQENAINSDFSLGYRFIDEDKFSELSEYELLPGDVIVTMMGTTGKCKVVPANIVRGIMDSHLIRMRMDETQVTSELISLLINDSRYIYNQLRLNGRGSIMEGLNSSIVKGLLIALPPLAEQVALATYLDEQTAQLDGLIARKRRLMALLREEKAALINEAVTKGIRPNVPTKPSGIDWLGDVPAHWEIGRVKHVCKIQGRIGFKGYKTSDLVPFGEGAMTLGSSHITKTHKIDISEPVYLNWEKYYESPEIMVRKGDIVFSQRGAYLGKVGLIEENFGEVTINPSLILLKEIMIEASYLAYYLTSGYIVQNVNIISNSTAIPMISQDQLSNFYCLIPPIEEQRTITQYINEETAKIDFTVGRIEREIELMQEYRTALISEVVTGKVKVV